MFPQGARTPSREKRFLHIAAGDGIKALTRRDEESLSRNKAVLRLSMVQVEKIATLRNKIALHENFMMVQPIAAGTQQTEVKGERSGLEWGRGKSLTRRH
jgi:hypothetical protein